MVGLRGRRILITRARDQGARLAKAVEDLGGQVVWVPAIRTVAVPLDDAGAGLLRDLERFRWVAFTSENAVKFFFKALSEQELKLPAHLRLASVGPATSKPLLLRELKVEAQPEIFTGADLARLLVEKHLRGPLLLPCAAAGREEFTQILTDAGWNVVPLPVYETRPAVITSQHVWSIEQGIDAALFASPSAVNALWDGLPETARDVLRRAVCQPIGPTTSKALEAVGLIPAPLPPESTADGLVRAIVERLG